MKKSLAFLPFLLVLACKSGDDDGSTVVDPPAVLPVSVLLTSGSRANLLYEKTIDFAAGKDARFEIIELDSAQKFQTIDGFGWTLTGGSAALLQKMGAAERAALLKQIFGSGDKELAASFLRVSIGASDLDAAPFSYDDLPAGQTDESLAQFSLAKDDEALVPTLKEILAIRPSLKIMASPWSAPVWMKTNGSTVGGNLKLAFYGVYAKYFVKYVEEMKARGIAIEAVTVQNEPQHGGNNPSMVLSAAQEADFVKNHLGPAFEAASLSTKIVVWDHNCDNAAYPIAILDDAAAKKFVHGSAFHLYAGDISALSQVHERHPDRALYFTEQWTGKNGSFDGDLMWHMKNVVIGSMRNWSRTALEWNLANDPDFGPHTPGGCSECLGALTINGSTATKNVSFYIVGQASKGVPPGSVRIGSSVSSAFPNVAFRRPDGKTALIALNEGAQTASFNIASAGRWIVASLPPKSVGTFVW